MHGSIRDRLEDLLAGKRTVAAEEDMVRHLSSCVSCGEQLAAMKAQSEMLQLLRAPEELEPAPGFYARVLQRIEERAKTSIWSVLIYSPFGKRLVYASLSLTLLLGAYVVAQESRDGHLGGSNVFAQSTHEDVPVVGSEAEQRDAVLANFATHGNSALRARPVSYEGTLQ